ncbi:dynein-related subfamily AAA family protein [Spirosoma oryzae]|uniref:Dynein-related subfamily AAA family protein n=1 Tax=Spirosoma oryzae TaxID=1469603 RepID=A0A2T0SYL9_9BACT|nr:AAA family ATPase [Spirosoma oryzae]PRY38507.1 dynein-related subfamily AAA family protein [Spirosoma oryzae]
MRPAAFADLVKFCLLNNHNLLVKGAPGIGKTSIIEAVCRETLWTDGLPYELMVMHPVVSDPTDFKGLPVFQDGKARFEPYGDLLRLINADRPLLCFIDDIGQAAPAVQASLMQLLLARSIGEHKVSNHVIFMAATNRKSDNAGVSGILAPVMSRFKVVADLEVNAEDWTKWAIGAGMPTTLIQFIRFRPAVLEDEEKNRATRDMTNVVNPRTLAAVGILQNDNLPHHLEHESFKGAAGEAFASEYGGFLRIYRTLPDVDRIMTHPDEVAVPDEAMTQFALSGALIDRATKDTIDNILRFIGRLPKDIEVMTMKLLDERKPELLSTESPAFLKWVLENAEVTLGDMVLN